MIVMTLENTSADKFSDWLEEFTYTIADDAFFPTPFGEILLLPARKIVPHGRVFLTMSGDYKKGGFSNKYKNLVREYLHHGYQRPISGEILTSLIIFELKELPDGRLKIKADCQEVVQRYFDKLLVEITLRWPEVKYLGENYNLPRILKRSGIMDVYYLDLTTLGKGDGERQDERAAESRPAENRGGEQTLLSKPEKPAPPPKDSGIYAWFDWYHEMKDAGYKISLREVANESTYDYGYLKQVHMRYKAERGII